MFRGGKLDALQTVGRKTILGLALALLLCSGAMTFAPPVSAATAGTEGENAIFYGFVLPNQYGELAMRVRAVTPEGTVCGTGDVTPSEHGVGFYLIIVSSAADKLGCPVAGETIGFVLLAGPIDDGILALGEAQFGDTPQEFVVFEPGTVAARHLVAALAQ